MLPLLFVLACAQASPGPHRASLVSVKKLTAGHALRDLVKRTRELLNNR